MVYNNTTMTSCCPEDTTFGADPLNAKWTVVRGDTSTFRVYFLEEDETTAFDTDGWTYVASAYDFKGDVIDELDVVEGADYVDMTATDTITEAWGTGYKKVVAELAFDLQVTKADGTVWTPIIGTITVLGDTTGGL
jgi:uncharacterized protein YaiE (UPF0345 family)